MLNSTLRLGWSPTFSDILDSASRVPGPQAWATVLCLMLHFLFETEYSVALTGLQTCNVDKSGLVLLILLLLLPNS